MEKTFLQTKGPLAERLLASIRAGAEAGGDKRGRQSAALVVVRAGASYDGKSDAYVDISVYDAKDPIAEIFRLYELQKIHFERSDPKDVIPICGRGRPLSAEAPGREGISEGRADRGRLGRRLDEGPGRLHGLGELRHAHPAGRKDRPHPSEAHSGKRGAAAVTESPAQRARAAARHCESAGLMPEADMLFRLAETLERQDRASAAASLARILIAAGRVDEARPYALDGDDPVLVARLHLEAHDFGEARRLLDEARDATRSTRASPRRGDGWASSKGSSPRRPGTFWRRRCCAPTACPTGRIVAFCGPRAPSRPDRSRHGRTRSPRHAIGWRRRPRSAPGRLVAGSVGRTAAVSDSPERELSRKACSTAHGGWRRCRRSRASGRRRSSRPRRTEISGAWRRAASSIAPATRPASCRSWCRASSTSCGRRRSALSPWARRRAET